MTPGRYADLHLHTRHSDGSYEPAELVRRAKDLRFSAIALTDHDSVTGVAEGVEAGERLGVRVIGGVELSTLYNDAEAHIVGLFVDTTHTELISLIERAAEERRTRLVRIAELLAEQGIDVSAEDILEEAAGGSVGRVHMAEAMVRGGATSSINESFFRYLGQNKPAYVPKWSPTPAECCRVIHAAGGVAVFAHPGDAIDEVKIKSLVRDGCRALEAYYPTYGPGLTEAYVALARKLDVGVSGGSDCHGKRKSQALLGRVKVPMKYVEDLEARRDM